MILSPFSWDTMSIEDLLTNVGGSIAVEIHETHRTATFEMLCQFFGFIDDNPDDTETLAEIMAVWDERVAAALTPPGGRHRV